MVDVLKKGVSLNVLGLNFKDEIERIYVFELLWNWNLKDALKPEYRFHSEYFRSYLGVAKKRSVWEC